MFSSQRFDKVMGGFAHRVFWYECRLCYVFMHELHCVAHSACFGGIDIATESSIVGHGAAQEPPVFRMFSPCASIAWFDVALQLAAYWCQWISVEIELAKKVGVCRDGGPRMGRLENVECEFCLW